MTITQHARFLVALISVIILATSCSNEVYEPAMEALVSTQWLSEL